MKKTLITILGVFLIAPAIIKAQDITIDSIIDKLNDSQTKAMTNSTITKENNNIIIKTTAQDGTEVETKITHSDTDPYQLGEEVYSYYYDGNKEDLSVVTNAMVSDLWLEQFMYSIYELKGYTDEQITEFLRDIDYSQLFPRQDGIDVTMFSYDITQNGTHATGRAIDTFNAIPTRMKIETNNNNQTTPEEQTNTTENIQTNNQSDQQEESNTKNSKQDDKKTSETVENPKTGVNNYIGIGFVFIAVISTIYIVYKKINI